VNRTLNTENVENLNSRCSSILYSGYANYFSQCGEKSEKPDFTENLVKNRRKTTRCGKEFDASLEESVLYFPIMRNQYFMLC